MGKRGKNKSFITVSRNEITKLVFHASAGETISLVHFPKSSTSQQCLNRSPFHLEGCFSALFRFYTGRVVISLRFGRFPLRDVFLYLVSHVPRVPPRASCHLRSIFFASSSITAAVEGDSSRHSDDAFLFRSLPVADTNTL